VVQGTLDRLVPVLMTASTAALGLFPLLWGSPVGKELERPLAQVVLGGLLTSTFLNLVVIPTLYNRVEKWHERRRGKDALAVAEGATSMSQHITKVASRASVLLALLLPMGLTSSISSGRAEEPAATIAIPSTTTAIWVAIDTEVDGITNAIQADKLQELHHHAYAIRDLVAALPNRSSSLSPVDLARVKANVKFVATLAERLDAAGDSDDKTASESNFTKLKAILTSLHALYPNSTSK
jgi:hypothetical protein